MHAPVGLDPPLSKPRVQVLVWQCDLLGGLVGILAGIALSIGAAKVLGWPTLISPAAVAIAFAFAAGTGILFGYYPARKAASLEPIDALRYE